MRELTITKLARNPEGLWTARVTGADGKTVEVEKRHGVWRALVPPFPRSRARVRRELHKPVCAALQAKVKPLERKEVSHA